MKNRTRIFVAAAIMLIAAAAALYLDIIPVGNPTTVTMGAFAGSYWGVPNGNSYKIVDDAIEKFKAGSSAVNVEYESGIVYDDYSEWLAERFIEGNAPDVFFVSGSDFNKLASKGALKDLSGFIEGDADFDENAYYPSAYSCGSFNGTQYALPFESAVYLMFVNKTMLANEGIAQPASDWTWDDFYNICKSVTRDTDGDSKTDQYGVSGYTWDEAVTSNGADIFSEDGKSCRLSDERVVEAVEFIEQLEQLNEGYNVTSDSFDVGNVAFQPLMFSEYRAYKPYPLRVKKYSDFEWDCVTMPAGPSGGNISSMDTLLIAMNANTKNERLAWDFMKTLVYDEDIQTELFLYSEGASPLRRVTQSEKAAEILRNDNDVDVSLLDTAMENAKDIPSFAGYSEARELVDTAVRDITDGNSNIKMSLIKWQRDINLRLGQ